MGTTDLDPLSSERHLVDSSSSNMAKLEGLKTPKFLTDLLSLTRPFAAESPNPKPYEFAYYADFMHDRRTSYV